MINYFRIGSHEVDRASVFRFEKIWPPKFDNDSYQDLGIERYKQGDLEMLRAEFLLKSNDPLIQFLINTSHGSASVEFEYHDNHTGPTSHNVFVDFPEITMNFDRRPEAQKDLDGKPEYIWLSVRCVFKIAASC